MAETLKSQCDLLLSPQRGDQSEETAMEDAKQDVHLTYQVKKTKRSPVYNDTEFTFHPKVSTASIKMVENSGLDFLERQQLHVQKKLYAYEDSQCDVLDTQTSKHNKVNVAKHRLIPSRPCTSDHNILKKRSKLPRNSVRRQSSVLEPMDTQETPQSSSRAPTLPPRAKTYFPSSMAHSLTSSGAYGSGLLRKRSVNDPYANFDRLQKAKMIAEKAVKGKKIFSIHGPYPLIRKALRERGWVEKEFKLPLKLKGVNKPGAGDSSDIDDDDDDDDDDDGQKDSGIGTSPRPSFDSNENEENGPNDCYGIMGRMVRNEVPTFQWTTRTASIDWRFLQKEQIVNHYAKANFTTKVGLCMNLRMLSCFSEGHSDTFFPRCYRLSNEEDKLDFIDHFRLIAACAILKIAVARLVDDNSFHDDEKVQNGQLPPPGGSHILPASILQMAIRVCKQYGDERNHADIDTDDSLLHISDDNWDQLILHYTKLVHEGGTISQSGPYLKQCEEALSAIKERNPQFFIEGYKNTWIIKPGAKSRGRGIIVMNRLEEILKLVSGDSTLIKDSRWVVQKYIERPLLVYGTKFDVRQWFLVSDWNPVTVWIYKESYLRFSSRPFTLKNLEPCIHLCNYSVQKNADVDPSRNALLPADNMWSDADFRNYLRARGCHTLWEDKVFPGMKKAIVHICQTAQDTVEYRKSSFELYGADFMIDEDYNPWLIEVNSSPTMSRSTSVTSKLCASVQEDTLKVILDRKRDKNCDIGMFELMYKQPVVDVPLYVGKALNVEGVTIKKPFIPVRRPANPAMNLQNNSNNRNNNNNTVKAEVTQFASRSFGRAGSVYAQASSKPPKPKASSHHVESNNAVPSLRFHKERTKTPVKVKMQSTMKRLTSEAKNTPARPNAFNLPKCPISQSSPNNVLPSTATQTSGSKAQVQISAKANGALYNLKRPSEEGSLRISSNSPIHFVSSSQAKAASSMGITNLGSVYSSVVAAANRGCLPSKATHPYQSPQAVVPKTFPISGVPGGEVCAGGSTVLHPGPPPGVIALSPQTIGLSLPFQKYYNSHTDTPAIPNGQNMQRRGVTYGIQDFRLGGGHPRISGIQEWITKQQTDLCISCYYPPDNINPNTLTQSQPISNENSNAEVVEPTLFVPNAEESQINDMISNTDYDEFSKYLDNLLALSKVSHHRKIANGCPFRHRGPQKQMLQKTVSSKSREELARKIRTCSKLHFRKLKSCDRQISNKSSINTSYFAPVSPRRPNTLPSLNQLRQKKTLQS